MNEYVPPVTNIGVLSALVKQPIDNQPTIDENRYRLHERYKGPYNVIKEFPLKVFYPGRILENALSDVETNYFPIYNHFDAPDPGTGNVWIIDSCNVIENTPGDHGILDVECYAIAEDEVDPEQEETWTPVGDKTWNLTWGAYTVTPWAFMKNDPIEDPYPDDPDAPPPAKDYSQTTYRPNVEEFFNSKDGNKTKFQYMSESYNNIRQLNDAEQLIAKKVISQRNALYHYPVVSETNVYEKALSSVTSADYDFGTTQAPVGNDIDYIYATPTGKIGPFQFADPQTDPNNAWEFIKTADNITFSESKRGTLDVLRCTRTISYQGARSWDKNYYGNTPITPADTRANLPKARWKIGEI